MGQSVSPGKLGASEAIKIDQCMIPEAASKYLMNQTQGSYTSEGWAVRNILLDIHLKADAEADAHMQKIMDDQPGMWADGLISTRKQHEEALFREEFFGGAEIRNGLLFGALYYHGTGDRQGAEMINGLALGAGGMSADAGHYRDVGRGLIAATKPLIEPPARAESTQAKPVANSAATSDSKPDVYLGALRRWKITPTGSSRGVNNSLRAEVAAWAAKYGTMDGPPTTDPVHVGHQYGNSHVFTPNGETARVGAQTVRGNLSQSAAERTAAAFRRTYNAANPNSPQLPLRPKGK